MNEDTAARFRRFVRNPAFAWIGLLNMAVIERITPV